MILFLAGTKDAREVALALTREGYKLLNCVVTEEAAANLREQGLLVKVGRLSAEEIGELIVNNGITALIDATHPFAELASKNAIAGARQAGVPYLRYERQSISYRGQEKLLFADSYQEAVELARQLTGNILLATGSKTLEIFTEHLADTPDVNLFIRLLPTSENIAKCQRLGLDKRQIIAMQGPFSYELNLAMFRHYQINGLVTKETGTEGSLDEKVRAATALGITTIIINRPKVDYPQVYSTVEGLLEELAEK